MNILVRAPNWLGDIIMCLPAIHTLTELLPQSQITIATRKQVISLFNCTSFIRNIIPLEDKNNIKSIIEDYINIKKHSFTHTFIFTNSFSSVLPLLSIPIRIGYKNELRQVLLTNSFNIPDNKKKVHEIHYYLNLVQSYFKTNIRIPHIRYPDGIIKASKAGKEKLELTFKELKITLKRPLIVLHPFATYGSAKMWPIERFSHLIKNLKEEFPESCILIIGVEAQLDLANKLVTMIPLISKKDVYNICGKTDIETLVALLDLCDLLITNDSGPMHIASALNKPLVSIFGSTNPQTTGPLSDKSIVLKGEAPCSPCFLRECPKDLLCMKSISVESVTNACLSLLRRD